MRTHVLASALLGSCVWMAACAAQEEPPAVSAAAAAKQELLRQLAEAGIRIDEQARTITVDAEVNRPADPLEYLLIHRRGKGHEALFVTEVKPSLLNSAFLLLGYQDGKNARIEPIDPPPTEAEIEAGAEVVKMIEPEGGRLWISASWRGEDGAEVEMMADELLVDMTSGELVERNEWLFLGGRMAPLYRNEPAVYVADYEGNMVSICYLTPANHLATMKHERARDDQNWWMTKTCPPPGTPVQLRFHATEPARAKARREQAEQAKAAGK